MKKTAFCRIGTIAEKLMPALSKYRAVVAVLLAGMLLLASGGWFGGNKADGAETANADMERGFDLAAFERELNERLAAVEGVGRVELMLSLEETAEEVYAVNVRQSQNDGTGSSYEQNLTVLSDGSYGETPVTVKSLLPRFRGAIVLCDGADDAAVRLAVTQAVGTVCGIGTDKITVLKMEKDA